MLLANKAVNPNATPCSHPNSSLGPFFVPLAIPEADAVSPEGT